MLKLKNIKKIYNNKIILENINLTVQDNELTVLLGASGCGKSTLLKIISGIVLSDGGDIFLNEKNISSLAIHKRDTVIMFQEHNLFPHMNVFDNAAFALKIRKTKKNIIKERVTELLKTVKLEKFANKFPAELSGGQKQRVAIIRAIAVLPKVLLLDEPFANLDIRLRHEMQTVLKEIQNTTKVTTLMVTHDKDEAFFLADKIALMIGSKIKQIDTPEHMYHSPIDSQVADFFGNAIYIKGLIKNNSFSSNVFNFEIPQPISKDGECFLLARPEHIVEDKNGIAFTVTKKEFYGDRTLYELTNEHTTLQSYCLNNNSQYGDIVAVNFQNDTPVFFKTIMQ